MKRFWSTAVGIVVLAGLAATVVRFSRGLGAATNLSDEFPWGLWIGFDILVGVGLAAGGFVIAATVNVFQITRYNAIARPAILTAFLGYLLVIVALLFDLGRPYRIWHPLVMGNPHSVMFEVAMCVMLYTTVLALEFSPIVLSRLGLRSPIKLIHAAYIPLVIAGVLLSTLHQSSLGTLFVIVPDKLHGLWYTSLLPVFFFLSAIAAGLAMTIFESLMSSRAFGRRLEQDLLEGLARVIVVVLAVFLVWKIENLIRRGTLHLVFGVTPESVMFWGEMTLGVLLPMVLFMIPRVRVSQSGLFLGSSLTIMGFIVNRLNVAITGFARSSGVNYVPSWMEFAVTASIVAVGFILFGLAVKHLDVFPKEHASEPAVGERAQPVMSLAPHGRALAALWTFLLAGFLVFGLATRWQYSIAGITARPELRATVTPANTASLPDAEPSLIDGIVFPMAKDSPGVVTFNHTSHVDVDSPKCGGSCHFNDFRILSDGSLERPAITMDEISGGRYCGACHDGKKSFSADEDCAMCHDIDR